MRYHSVQFAQHTLKRYRAGIRKINDEFAQALAAEYLPGFNQTICNEVWRLAWEEGRNAGYHEVELWYDRLADLAKTIKEQNNE